VCVGGGALLQKRMQWVEGPGVLWLEFLPPMGSHHHSSCPPVGLNLALNLGLLWGAIVNPVIVVLYLDAICKGA